MNGEKLAGSAPADRDLAVRVGAAVMRLGQAEREYREAYSACLYECMVASSWGRFDLSLHAVRRIQDESHAWMESLRAKSGELAGEGSAVASLLLGRGHGS